MGVEEAHRWAQNIGAHIKKKILKPPLEVGSKAGQKSFIGPASNVDHIILVSSESPLEPGEMHGSSGGVPDSLILKSHRADPVRVSEILESADIDETLASIR